ncbi:MAG TPA: deoxyribonuclease IV [Methanospirillum sp.]|nr:deoxyribonuclease IV [Methanospirillum sp.]
MVRVGVHVSIAGSLAMSCARARERDCDCFQIFTKNPRGWAAKEITESDADSFRGAVSTTITGPVFAHMPYLPNLASEKPDIYAKSIEALSLELGRCSFLGIPFLVTHLGHAGDDLVSGRKRVVDAIDEVLQVSEKGPVLLLENTAGERNSVGSRFEEMSAVLDGIADSARVGICLDTCHAFAAGYDLRGPVEVSHVFDTLDNLVGSDKIGVIHLNDAKGTLGSGLDRHEHIGLGSIGEDGIRAILHHPILRSLPCICETPVDERRGDRENVSVVRTLSLEKWTE